MENIVANNDLNNTKKKSKKGLIIGLIILAILAIVGTTAGLLYAFVFSIKTIDLSDCIKVAYTGYEGHAVATVELDEEKLKEIVKDSKVAEDIIKKAKIDIGYNKDLSNGDEIDVEISIPESFLKKNKLKVKNKEFTYTVNGVDEYASIDLSEYIDLNLKGFNKHAKASPYIDLKLRDALGYEVFSEFNSKARLSIEKNENLENGKEVEVKVTISESWLKDNKIKVKSLTPKVMVSGLEDGIEFDAFKDMKIVFSGMSPDLSLTIKNESNDEFGKTIRYRQDKATRLANGDEVEITVIGYDDELAEKKGYVINETTMKYKIENQPSYIASVDEIDGVAKNEIKSILIEKTKARDMDLRSNINTFTDYLEQPYSDWINDLKAGEPEVVSMYLLTKKDDSFSTYTNKLVGIVRASYTSASSGITYNWYVPIIANNIAIIDGKVSDKTEYSSGEFGGETEEVAKYVLNSEDYVYKIENIPVN